MENPTREIPWTREQVVQEILKIHQLGLFPTYVFATRNDPELLESALSLYRDWESALAAAGVIRPRFDSDEFFDHELCAWVHDSLTVPVGRLGF